MGNKTIINTPEQPEDKKEKTHNYMVIVVGIIALFIVGGYNSYVLNDLEKQVKSIDTIKSNMDTLKYNQDLIIATQEKFGNDLSKIQDIDTSVSELWLDKLNEAGKKKFSDWQKNNTLFLNCKKNFNKLMIRSSYLNVNHNPGYFLISTYDKGEFVIAEKGDAWCWKYPIMTLEQVPVDCSNLCINEDKLNETKIEKKESVTDING